MTARDEADDTVAGARDRPLDPAARDAVLASALELLKERYVFLETAERMAAAVRRQAASGAYDALTSCVTFGARLERDLQAVSHDKHLRVLFDYTGAAGDDGADSVDKAAALHTRLAAQNFGFSKVECLPGNVGYLDLRCFGPSALIAPTVAAAFALLAHTHALIIDLRNNEGGEPAAVALISSYLLDSRTHLTDIYSRWNDRTESYWTRDEVPGPRHTKELFLLTSSRTFSAAEDFAYNLKHLKRATLIGEVTAGGAHPVDEHRIHAHLRIRVPFARSINPITKTNWEGSGVEPDESRPAEVALRVAHLRALENLRARGAGADDAGMIDTIARLAESLTDL